MTILCGLPNAENGQKEMISTFELINHDIGFQSNTPAQPPIHNNHKKTEDDLRRPNIALKTQFKAKYQCLKGLKQDRLAE